MAASGVGQYSVGVKTNLKEFYGELTKAKREMNELVNSRKELQIDSRQLDQLRDKSQRVSAQMRALRQQKTEIKLGMTDIKNTELAMDILDRQIAKLNRQKLEIDAEIQPIRTANVELYKVEKEIDKLNKQKVSINFGDAGNKIDGLANKVLGLTKKLGALGVGGVTAVSGVLKESVAQAGRLEQNLGAVEKLYGKEASKKIVENAENAFKEAGLSQNEYYEQATKLSAGLITSLEKGQTKTIDSSSQKEALKQQKADIEKAIKENSYATQELNLNAEVKYEYTTDKNGKTKRKKIENAEQKTQLKDYKQNALELKKQKDKIDEQIANLPESTTVQVGGMSNAEAQKQAADYIDKALIDMSDNVNTFGTDISEVQHAYEGILRNNYTMIDNLKLGFKGTQKGVIEAVNAYGNLDEKVTDISQVTLPVMIDTIHNAQEAMKITGTTAKEASTTYEGSLNMMKSAWLDFLATGKSKQLEIALPIYFENLDKKLKELTPQLINGLKKMVKVLPPKLKPVFEDLKILIEESFDTVFGKGFSDRFKNGMKPFVDFFTGIFKMITKSTEGEAPDLSKLGSLIPNLLKIGFGLKGLALVFKGIQFGKDIGAKLPNLKFFSGFGKLGDAAKGVKKVGVNDIKSIGTKILAVAGLSANIWLAAKALQEVSKIDGDFGGMQEKLFLIGEALMAMEGLTVTVNSINKSSGSTAIKGFIAIAGIAGELYIMAKALQEVDKINSDFLDLQAKIGQIALVLVEMGALALGAGFILLAGPAGAAMLAGLTAIALVAGELVVLAKAFEEVGKTNLDKEKIKTNIQTINECLALIKFDNTIFDAFEKVGQMLNSLLDIGLLGEMIVIAKEIEALQKIEIDQTKATEKIKTIQTVLESLSIGKFWNNTLKWFRKSSKLDELNKSKEIVHALLNVSKDIESIQDSSVNAGIAKTKIDEIKKVLANVAEQIPNISSNYSKERMKGLKQSKEVLEKINDISKAAELLNNEKLGQSSEKILNNIKIIKEVIAEINTNTQITDLDFAKFMEKGYASVKNSITSLVEITKQLETLQGKTLDKNKLIGEDGKGGNIGILGEAIKSISNFATDEIANNLQGMSAALAEIMKILDANYPEKFNELGKKLAEKTNEGYKGVLDFPKIIKDKINEVKDKDAKNIGKRIATGFNTGFKETLTLGKAVSKSIEEALKKDYSTTINVKTKTDNGSSSSKKSTSNTSNNPNRITPAFKLPEIIKASGGKVTVDSILQDSSEKPLLNNGEYVIPKKIVDALGTPFFDNLRNGNISRTFAGLAQSVSNTTSNVVNNVYNTTNNQNVNVHTTGRQDLMMKANRRFRMA